MKAVIIPILASVLLVGCGSSDSSMSQKDAESFKPKQGGPRDPAATKGIADFKAKFDAEHGGGTNMPPQAQIPSSGK